MKNTILSCLAAMIALSSCSQNTKQNQPAFTDIKVGGSCEGCEAVYESPIPFAKLDHIDTLPDFNEQGPKIEISGVIYKPDGKTPAKDVILYVYHTDQKGLYARKENDPLSNTTWGRRHGYIRGWIKTNEKGEYRLYTLVPASYPNSTNPKHIHPTIKEPGFTEYWIDEFVFEDDPLLPASERNRSNPVGGNGVLKTVPISIGMKDGMLRATRNIILGLHVRDYPDQKQSYKSDDINKWTELTAKADFPKSYNFQLFSIRDTLWAFHSDGNWFSINGKDWIKSDLPNSINNLAFLDYIVFKDAVYGLGHFEGNIERFNLTSSIFKTTDLKNWTTLAEKTNLPNRFFYHPFVFNNKIWIIGGSDGINEFADAWNSEDGILWVKQADDLPFGKRAGSQFILFNDKIYMLNNDVWSSTDAVTWIKETNEIVPGEEIFGYAAVIYNEQMWLLGCNRNGRFKSEILVSHDGKKFTAMNAPWSPRGGIAATIHHGKIFMTGGKYGGPGIAGQTEFIYSNDVWALGKDEMN